MASALLHQRCFHHAEREAVSRCPSCARFFCRECVIEHEDRLICAACLRKLTARSGSKARAAAVLWILLALAGLLMSWILFYYAGRGLMTIPAEFHSSEAQRT